MSSPLAVVAGRGEPALVADEGGVPAELCLDDRAKGARVSTAGAVGGEASVLGRKLTKRERHMQAFSLTVTQRRAKLFISVLGRKIEER